MSTFICWKCEQQLFPSSDETIKLIDYQSLLNIDTTIPVGIVIGESIAAEKLKPILISRYVHKTCWLKEDDEKENLTSIAPKSKEEIEFISHSQIHPQTQIGFPIQHTSNNKTLIIYEDYE